MLRVGYIFVFVLLSFIVKVTDSAPIPNNDLLSLSFTGQFSIEKQQPTDKVIFHLSSHIAEKDDETKGALALLLPNIGFNFLYENYSSGKITKRADFLSFILFETDSSPPYL